MRSSSKAVFRFGCQRTSHLEGYLWIRPQKSQSIRTPRPLEVPPVSASTQQRCSGTYITGEYRNAFLGQVRDMVQREQESHNTDLEVSRIKKDEQAVSAVMEIIKEWNNPFSENHGLASISTAKTPPSNVTTDLMKGYEIGEKCYATLKTSAWRKSPKYRNFTSP